VARQPAADLLSPVNQIASEPDRPLICVSIDSPREPDAANALPEPAEPAARQKKFAPAHSRPPRPCRKENATQTTNNLAQQFHNNASWA
jgi:hypothetical protein